MSVLFAASEPGSCRAVLPVALACREAGLPVHALGRGSMAQEAPASGLPLLPCPENEAEIDTLLAAYGVRVVVFSSNVSDPLPLAVARRGAQLGAQTLHVLDYWNGYAGRMTLDGLPPFSPDVYAVPDEMALDAALKEGLAAASLLVSGQPAFADCVADVPPSPQERRALRQAAGCDPDLPLLLFVSEPVCLDQGSDPSRPDYRGYTERTVLDSLLACLRPLAGTLQLAALAHPREDPQALDAALALGHGALEARRISPARGRDALGLADGVAGMASTLLYEAWLHGLPVASLQPGLRQPSLALMRQRRDVFFADREEMLKAPLTAWLKGLGTGPRPALRPEASLHAGAVARLLDLVRQLSGRARTANREVFA